MIATVVSHFGIDRTEVVRPNRYVVTAITVMRSHPPVENTEPASTGRPGEPGDAGHVDPGPNIGAGGMVLTLE